MTTPRVLAIALLAQLRPSGLIVYSTLGAFPWSVLLVWAGVQLGANWVEIRHMLQPFDMAIAALVVVGALGLIALALLLGAEISVGMLLRGLSLAQILFDRDPVSGPAYYASLAYFAILPWYLSRR